MDGRGNARQYELVHITRNLTSAARNNVAWNLYGTSTKTQHNYTAAILTNTTMHLLSCPWELILSVLQSPASSWRTAHTFQTTNSKNGKSKILHTKMQADTMLFDNIYPTNIPSNEFPVRSAHGLYILEPIETQKKEITGVYNRNQWMLRQHCTITLSLMPFVHRANYKERRPNQFAL